MDKIEEEEPLDPVLENVRRKLMRSMAWSIGILMMGLLVLLFAIVYKINQPSDDVAENANPQQNSSALSELIDLKLDSTTKIISSNLSGDRLKLHFKRHSGSEEIQIIDLKSGNVLSRIKLKD